MLFAIGIRHVGETVAKKLARNVGSMERLAVLSQEELVQIEEVGSVIAKSIIDFFAVEGNRAIVGKLKEHGVSMEVDPDTVKPIGDKLKGLSFVVSGVSEFQPRQE